jgi:MFS family permease
LAAIPQWGVVVGLVAASSIGIRPWTGRLGDSWGRRSLMLVGLGTGAASFVGYATAPELLSLSLRASAVSTFTMSIDIALGIGAAVLGAVATLGSYRASFGGGAVCALVGLLVLRTRVIRPRRRRGATFVR